MNKIEQEDRAKIKSFIQHVNNGSVVSANQIVDLYNKVFDGVKHKQSYTRCSSCLIRFIREMHNEVIKQENEEKLEALKAIDEFMMEDEEPIEEKLEALKAIDEFMIEDDDEPIEEKPKKKSGRPKKNG